MNAPAQQRKSWWTRVLDGNRAWGSVDVWPVRHGLSKYRLVVLPPGISTAERRLVRLARSWPIWGTALWLVLAMGLSGHGEGWTTVAYPTIASIGCGTTVFVLAGAARANVRTMSVVLIDGHRDATSIARYAHLERLVLALVAADAMASRGELTVVGHEAVWWTVYEALGSQDHLAPSLGSDDRPQ